MIKYNEYVARLKSAKQDLEVLLLKKQSEIDDIIDIIEKKRFEIEVIDYGKKEYERKIHTNSVNVGADLYLENELYSKLKHHIEKDLQPMTNKEISWLENCFKGYMPLTVWKKQLKSAEYLVCLLVKIGFTPSEIAILTARSKSAVANIRKRLMLKMTGHDGSSKEFDEFIKGL